MEGMRVVSRCLNKRPVILYDRRKIVLVRGLKVEPKYARKISALNFDGQLVNNPLK